MPRRIRPAKFKILDLVDILIRLIRMCVTIDDPFA
ncbi:hypothetical protein ACVI1J_006631 [Bradyrhizobium diazoefficiens]